MLSDQDFQKLWFLYKTTGAMNNISMREFCTIQNFPYMAFDKRYSMHRKKRVQLQGDDMGTADEV